MAEFDLMDGLRKMFLAGVGAVATGAEKSQEVVEELVKKGELTVEQGKTLNEELTHKVKEAVDDSADKVLRARLESMTPEERAAFAAKVAEMSADIEAASVKVEVENADEGAAPSEDAAE
ncbi:MAG TPA: phasin family protein [Candidatus Olsenella pullistercoris]|uniref:Phasin family protein n=1 Tax=Candidatus Olsenella pullistercoris TaxID=2838712 RepID=A0A9D2EZH2_9ACTN|nr:phasin family protein [Candidatus Olsenella pullistercoris]